MTENLVWDLILNRFGPNLVPKIFFVDFTSTRCYTLSKAIIVCNSNENYGTKLEKMAKKLILGLILTLLAQKCFSDFC